ncbi:MAG TPA: glycoside hydrolase family 3 C-terminal domain-containing protein, partial [Rhodothermales bacterium]|nr:glycoside hydrolase family 3 C-terminal domain-containing protein [Rhodothermales bacterium]
ARAKHHEYDRRGKHLRYQGLTFWSPNINIFRDPRWGRGQETYGEDPFLTGALAVQFIRGLQGDDPNYLKTVATSKHFAVHSGPEPDRHHFDARVSERDLRETYLPHFERTVREADVRSFMCAYNRVGGDAACGSSYLLDEILRGEWGWDGYVVSDCWALDDIFLNHKLVETPAEAAAMALKAGTDLDCGTNVFPYLVEAIESGMVEEADIDRAVKRLFTARFRLGMFDPPERVEYAQIPYSILDSGHHKMVAREVARQSIVLLKNDGLLPLPKDLGKIAVIGPNADQWLMLLGNYNGVPSDIVTPLRAIHEAVGEQTEVVFAQGSETATGSELHETVPSNVLFGPDGQPGLHVEYYAGVTIEGAPLFTGRDATLDANWHDAAPRDDLDDDDFGVRWTGILKPEVTGAYSLAVISTMRFEFFLDDELALRSSYNYRDEYGDPRQGRPKLIELEAGREYRIRLDAHETYSDAMVQFVWAPPRPDLEEEAVAAASGADAVILTLGLTPRLEGEEMPVHIEGFEGGDRTRIDLPDVQQQLMKRIVALGRPTVLVLLNGSALAVNWAQDNVPAIVEAWYGGQAAGTAIADVIFGDYNPAGRLPVTFYQSVADLPPFEDYSMSGHTYRFFEGEPLYPFGHGLSYTTFEYSNLQTNQESIARDGEITVTVDVTNTGLRSGDEVVQLYVRYLESDVDRPVKELKGFERISIDPGHTESVEFKVPVRELAYWDVDRKAWIVETKPVAIQVGASSADIRLSREINVE